MADNTVRFLLFADFHYKQGMYLSPISDVEKMMKFAKESFADFVLHCGDYCNDYIGSPEAINPLLNNIYGLSVYGVYGNHELESKDNSMAVVTPLITNRRDTVIWGTADGKIGDGNVGYYYFDNGDFRVICLDTNYSFNEELNEWQHNLTASWGAPKDNIKPNSLGPVQLSWFEELLLKSAKDGKKCIVLSHATFNREWSGCSPDSDVVFDLINKVNEMKNGTVIMAINGHYHKNRIEKKDSVLFFDVNAVRNGCWVFNAPKHYDDNHTFEYIKYDENGEILSSEIAPLSELWQSGNTWYFKEPLFAVVTVLQDGTVNIEGAKTEWIYGVEPQNQPNFVTPEITGGNFKLF